MIANVILLIVGALIAIAAAAAAQFVQHWIQVGHRRCRLAAALAGEVDAIMTIARHRRLREALNDLRNRIDQEQEPHAFTLHVAQDYFQVYKNNTADIGLLPVHEAGCVARFYIGVFSWVQDVIRPDPEVTVEAAKARIDEQLKLLDYLEGLGQTLVNDLSVLSQQAPCHWVCRCCRKVLGRSCPDGRRKPADPAAESTKPQSD